MKLPSPIPDPRSPIPSRRGSALLIVIGMVSFMVISSVAFSIYMRTSRLPSNYLRRGTSSRMLLKSALAGAIERIDGVWRADPDASSAGDVGNGFIEGIYDDLYPGLNAREGQTPNRGNYPYAGNRFVRRVFAPFRDIAPPSNPNEPNPSEPIPVSTLTLEGLAYLPPALINDVRLQSHRTKTACWCNLAYEYGRYAFCAVDVSDCFDVNKLRPNSARTSAARQRVGFSTLFADENAGLSAFDTGSMQDFGSKLNGVGNVPLVSMADFNVFFGESAFTPFCKYVGQSGNLAILGDGDRVAANALFTTDTWFPPTNSLATVRRYVLSGVQPFDEFDDAFNAKDVLDSANATSLGKQFIRRLGGVGTIMLYDYLDADNVPTSYALPTVETAPMVCALGVEPQGGLKTTVRPGTTRTATYPSGVKNPDTGIEYDNRVIATPYELDLGTSAIMVQGQLVFPFKRLKGKGYCLAFKVEGLVRVFLAPAALHSRVDPNSPLLAPNAWEDGEKDGVITRKVEFTDDFTWSDDIAKPEDAVRPFQKPVAITAAPRTLFWKIDKYVVDKNGNLPANPTETWFSLDGVTKGADRPVFYDEKGLESAALKGKAESSKAKDEVFKDGAKFARGVKNEDIATQAAAAGQEIDATRFVPHIAVWVKVSNGEGEYAGKVVDVVPAYQKDDEVWGGRGDPGNNELATVCALETPPVLRFSGTTDFPYGIGAEAATANNEGALGWSVLYTVDPRFNYAPEAWYSASVAPATLFSDKELWLNSLSGVFGTKVADRDIFMFTSDQEYLQAMGELQFLPALRDLAEAPSGRVVEDMAEWRPDATAPKTTVDEVLKFMPGMLETYSAPDGDPVYSGWTDESGNPVDIVSSVGDFRVNPFTSDDRIFRAAIANTPYDWFAASTNEELNVLGTCDYGATTPKPTADNSKALSCTFSSKSQCQSAKWRDNPDDANSVYDIADELRDRLRTRARAWEGEIAQRPSWEGIYDAIWGAAMGEGANTFFGIQMDHPLHGVDRKFLHGFWRECFGNRQQLFLIFLRAEPLTVGGSGTASMANAQTGARGVALVWRDPEPPLYHRNQRPRRTAVSTLDNWKCDNDNAPAPHRTRVLFYHQFD